MKTAVMLMLLILPCLIMSTYAYRYYTIKHHEKDFCELPSEKKILELDSQLIHGNYITFSDRIVFPQGSTSCSFQVVSPIGYGVLAAVQSISMKKNSNGSCEDYVQFSDGEKSTSNQICGYGTFGGHQPPVMHPWQKFSKFSNKMEVLIATGGFKSLKEEFERMVDVKLAFVVFKNCLQQNDPEWRKCPFTSICIRRSLFCDDIISCPVISNQLTGNHHLSDEHNCSDGEGKSAKFIPMLLPDPSEESSSTLSSHKNEFLIAILPCLLLIILVGILHCWIQNRQGCSNFRSQILGNQLETLSTSPERHPLTLPSQTTPSRSGIIDCPPEYLIAPPERPPEYPTALFVSIPAEQERELLPPARGTTPHFEAADSDPPPRYESLFPSR